MSALIVVLLLLLWAFFALHALPEAPIIIPKMLRSMIDEPTEQLSAFAFIGILVSILGYLFLHGTSSVGDLLSNFFANSVTEFASIAITVLILDRLYAKRAILQEKERIIKQMGSLSNEFALEATRNAKELGLLGDGSLEKVSLAYANLQHANLKAAFLQGANLLRANLSKSYLEYADLRRANLWEANLQGTYLGGANLDGANLEEANLNEAYLVRANLQNVCLANANLYQADLRDSNLLGAYIWGANLELTKYNRNTIWPSKFDPIIHGAVFVDDD